MVAVPFFLVSCFLDYVEKVSGNVYLRILPLILIQKPSCCLRRLDVHGTYLRKEGMAALLAGIQHNTSLISLNAAGHEVQPGRLLFCSVFLCSVAQRWVKSNFTSVYLFPM